MLAKILRAPGVLLWMAWQIIRASWAVTLASITPGPVGPPVLLRYRLTGTTDVQVTALCWAITVTPGTLVVAIGEHDIYVHCVLGGERDELTAEFQEMERRLLTVLGPPSLRKDEAQ